MTPKRVTLAIAILSTLATALLALEGTLPPKWALLAASLGAGAYALARGAQKVKEGVPLKSLLSTTETWGAGLAIAAGIASAVAGVVSPEVALSMMAVSGFLLKVSRLMQTTTSEKEGTKQ